MAARMTHALKVSPRRDDALQRPDPPAALLSAVKVMYAGAVFAVIQRVVFVVTAGATKSAIEAKHPHMGPQSSKQTRSRETQMGQRPQLPAAGAKTSRACVVHSRTRPRQLRPAGLPQVRAKLAASSPAQAPDMTRTRPFPFRSRNATEPEPGHPIRAALSRRHLRDQTLFRT
jgi:hypothetical protein